MSALTIDQFTQMMQSRNSGNKKLILEEKERVKDLGPCWVITSHKSRSTDGYPYMTRHRRNYNAYVVAYLIAYKERDNTLDISHLCETAEDRGSRECINPNHLIQESRGDNLRRSTRVGRWDRKAKGLSKATNIPDAFDKNA
jgi:hypothetical protein